MMSIRPEIFRMLHALEEDRRVHRLNMVLLTTVKRATRTFQWILRIKCLRKPGRIEILFDFFLFMIIGTCRKIPHLCLTEKAIPRDSLQSNTKHEYYLNLDFAAINAVWTENIDLLENEIKLLYSSLLTLLKQTINFCFRHL